MRYSARVGKIIFAPPSTETAVRSEK